MVCQTTWNAKCERTFFRTRVAYQGLHFLETVPWSRRSRNDPSGKSNRFFSHLACHIVLISFQMLCIVASATMYPGCSRIDISVMKLSSCDVTSCRVLAVRFCVSRMGRTGGGAEQGLATQD